jgi:hypothetical protein
VRNRNRQIQREMAIVRRKKEDPILTPERERVCGRKFDRMFETERAQNRQEAARDGNVKSIM